MCLALLAGPLSVYTPSSWVAALAAEGNPASLLAEDDPYYVKADAAGANNGTSWVNAYRRLQDALSASLSGDEIWVAAGVYTPTTALTRTDTFQLKAEVAVYGGFAGDETAREQRNWTTHVVTLTGDLLGDDGLASYDDNSYHVVTGANGATLDGVTITGGNANGTDPDNYGGGMYNLNASLTLSHVTFSGNSANDGGGGMYSRNSHPTLTNVAFSGNSAHAGGGLYNLYFSDAALTNVTFSGNTAIDTGGGMYNDASSSAALTNVAFTDNEAANGGGLHNWSSGASLTNVLFSGNLATNNGGGLANVSSSLVLTNVTFSGNRAAGAGGAIYDDATSPQAVNSILWGDTPDEIHNKDAGSVPVISCSLVQGGYSGIGNLDSDPLFVTPISATTAPTTTGNLRLRFGSPAIDAGNNSYVLVATDLSGNPRVDGGAVDMGAYESQRIFLPLVRR